MGLRGDAAHLAMIASGKGKKHDEYYEEYQRAYDEIYKRLGANKEAYTLLNELSMAANASSSLEIDAAYIQGFQDGMRFRDLLALGPNTFWGNRRGQTGENEVDQEGRPA